MVEIKLSDLTPNKYNPREIFRGAAMEELKDSMADVGLIHPILVRPLKNNKSEVVAGMRRYYAAKDLKWESIECHSRELSDLDAIKIAFSENIKRENLNPIELGQMYQTYIEYLPQTETKNEKTSTKTITKLRDEVATTFKISNVTVRNYISLLSLPDELRSLIVLNHGDIKKGFGVYFGIELARLPLEQIMDFYNLYNPNDYTYKEYQKKVSEKISELKLAGEAKRNNLEKKLEKVQLELEKLIQRQEAFEERINKNLETLEGDYDDVEKAIGF